MLPTIYQELRTISEPASPQQEEQALLNTFDRLTQILTTEEVSLSQELEALVTLFAQVMSRRLIALAVDSHQQFSHLTLVVWHPSKQRLVPMIVFPRTYLTQVREDPLQQLGCLIHLAGQVRDLVTGQLDQKVSIQRAQAFEAEFLRQMQQQHNQEGLPWVLNEYQQSLMQEYPEGLASLSPELIYPTPTLMMLIELPEEENGQ